MGYPMSFSKGEQMLRILGVSHFLFKERLMLQISS